MYTIAEAMKQLGITKDQLHYKIKRGVIQPQREGKRFFLSDEDIEMVRQSYQRKTKPSAAIIQLQVAGKETENAVDTLHKHFPQVVWAAGAWGDCSVIALLEAPKLELIASVPLDLGKYDYVRNTKTSIIPSSQYHVKETPPIAKENERLAVVLINAEKSPRKAPRVVEDLSDIPEVRTWGTMLGQWAAFAEIRYEDADRLYAIVMDTIYEIDGIVNTTTILTMRKLRREGTSSIDRMSEVIGD
jgi:DNA-binding Lrp family transcriptional regulator/DNA-binding transcriptional MerR regulator